VGGKMITRSGILSALCLPIPSVMAQDAGGVQIVAGIEQGIEAGRNIALEVPDEGNSLATTTRLSFGISSETPIERLSLDLNGVYRIEDQAGETNAGFEDPALTLRYTRNGANGSFDVSANYTRAQVDTLRTITDFVPPDGEVEIPADFTDLTGTGERTAYGADATLILGRDSPLGFQFDLGTSGIIYSDTTDTGLTDIRRARVEAATRLQLSPKLTGNVSAGYETIDEDDATQTERVIRNVGVGLTYLASPRATIDTSIGYVWNRTDETTGVTNDDNVTGRLAFGYDMPNGVAGAVFDTSRTDDGTSILSARLSRSLSLPAGLLSASIGVTQPGDNDVALIGSLNWAQPLPTGRIAARVDRSVGLDADNDIRLTTVVGADYGYDINPVSSLSLGLSYAVSDASPGANRVEQANVAATYSHALTADWDFNATADFTVRDETDVGQATSPQISATIGRTFRTRR
jgi:hypothetical protein